MYFLCCHLSINASAEIMPLFKLTCYSTPVHQLQAFFRSLHTQNALLLHRFEFTNQSKADNNTFNGLLKWEGDFHSRHLSSDCCLRAIMKNLYQLLKTAQLKNWTISSRFFLLGKRDTSLKKGTVPLKTGRLVTLIQELKA
jgi:hypothetical protein